MLGRLWQAEWRRPATRLLPALALPFLALALQWVLWQWIAPFVWFLFFPAVFFSARLGGLWGGLASTALSIAIVWYFFVPPQLSWAMDNPANGYSMVLFLVMGFLISDAQERLRRAQRDSEAALEETRAASERINQLYRRTLELDELKTQFFANVSHELRTPLTLIMSPLMQRLSDPKLSAQQRREDETMLRNARLLYRHVNDLLDVAKLEAGRMAVDYARIDLVAMARAMAAQFDAAVREKQFDFRIEAPATLEIEGDGEKIQRILLNLLSNGFKFTPVRGSIELRLGEQGGQAEIAVQDNGPGVPPELREAVFERFRQGEGGAQRRHGGTGLGLAIVREFAELHGGSARVVEAPGGGALFSVRLPTRAPAGTTLQADAGRLDPLLDLQVSDELRVPQGIATAPADLAGAAQGSLVLVVEDNADMNEFIAATLRPHYRVASAFDGGEGLQAALALRPDLIVSDLMMPRMSGDQMLEELRREAGMDTVPVLVLTAKADDRLRVRLLEQGVQAYLHKPFSTDELLARVAGLLRTRRRTVEELARSEAALREAQRLTGVGNWEWDLRADRHSWSEQIYAIYGRDPALPPAVYPEVSTYFAPDSWERLATAVERGLAAGVPYECDAEVIRPDGGRRWITARGQATRDADGNIVELHGTVQDITARKQAEEQIRGLNADLEQRVTERTLELTAANRDLVAVNQELDSFAYAVSHDLRAPLRAMTGFSHALIEDYGERLDGEARTYLDQISTASRKMDELIDGILVLSRISRGEMRRDEVDISALATRLLEQLARGEPERQIDWQVEPGLSVRGDARMLEALMGNLLANAWKYTGKTAAAAIHVHGGEASGKRRICVADNGAGFDMAHAARLFKPFQRLHRQDEFPGIGIGLATVQRIVRRHGGEIFAQGRPGAGAEFCFELPLCPVEEPA